MPKFIEKYRQSCLPKNNFVIRKEFHYLNKYWITKYNKLKTSCFIASNVKESQPSNSCRIDLPNGIVIHLTGSEGLTLILEIIRHVSDQ